MPSLSNNKSHISFPRKPRLIARRWIDLIMKIVHIIFTKNMLNIYDEKQIVFMIEHRESWYWMFMHSFPHRFLGIEQGIQNFLSHVSLLLLLLVVFYYVTVMYLLPSFVIFNFSFAYIYTKMRFSCEPICNHKRTGYLLKVFTKAYPIFLGSKLTN